MELEKIVVASGNKGKIAEIKAIFKGVEVIPMRDAGFTDEVEETGSTFKENAKLKAEAVAKVLNLPALSDDSGLCVECLNGAPGIYSARFSGEGEKGNRKLLLKRMEHCTHRRAYFESAVCLCLPDGKTFFGEGRTYGKILYEEIGENGFGYDSLFYSDDLKKSFGLATDEEKNSVSHRYRALCDLRNKL
ncbi:MAG: RdgB/HAM1 family non-canonical purine NTP pyrophosphatase [Clostridia bacterium]|nr:RdgB/HAM1 family non-canonical purine NTP pyrophosphatase [Clostridia bacterium]